MATTGESESMPERVEVELDILSGMPNPTWVLTKAEAKTFAEHVSRLPRGAAAELAGNLGYRGFIIHVTRGGNTSLIRIQAGTVHLSTGTTVDYARDENRQLERWLLNTGRSRFKGELWEVAAREIR